MEGKGVREAEGMGGARVYIAGGPGAWKVVERRGGGCPARRTPRSRGAKRRARGCVGFRERRGAARGGPGT